MHRILLGAASAAMACAASAQAGVGVGVDGSIGTQGGSANLHWQVTPFLTLRGGANFLEFEVQEQEFDDIQYDVELNMTQFGGYVDVHPFLNGFTLTGGMLSGERTVQLLATPTQAVEIGDFLFTPDQVGTLLGEADFGNQSYYGGIGWDSTTHGKGPVSLVIRLGVIMTDSPELSLDSIGGLAESDPLLGALLDAAIEDEIAQLESDFEDLRFYPVLSLGLGIGF